MVEKGGNWWCFNGGLLYLSLQVINKVYSFRVDSIEAYFMVEKGGNWWCFNGGLLYLSLQVINKVYSFRVDSIDAYFMVEKREIGGVSMVDCFICHFRSSTRFIHFG